MTQKKHNRLTEEDPKALFNTHQATVHLDEIQAMLDDGLPVYIEINADVARRRLYDLAINTDMGTMAGDIIKLTRNSITDILGIPMINAQSYVWSTDTYRAIIPVEKVGNSSGCSKCVFERVCNDTDCFNYYYEYRQVITDEYHQVITDGHKVLLEKFTGSKNWGEEKMNKIIDNKLIERYERFIGLQNEMYEVYRYRHAIVRNDVTQWVEATDRLSHILWKIKERWIERPELIEMVQEHNTDTGVKYDY